MPDLITLHSFLIRKQALNCFHLAATGNNITLQEARDFHTNKNQFAHGLIQCRLNVHQVTSHLSPYLSITSTTPIYTHNSTIIPAVPTGFQPDGVLCSSATSPW